MWRRVRRVVNALGKYLAALVVLIVMGFPLYGLVLTSIQRESDIRSPDLELLPRYIVLEHYQEVLKPGHIVPIKEAMANSLIVSTLTAIVTVVLAVPAAYALTRMRMPGRKLVLAALISVYLCPTLLFILPLYIKAVQMRLIDTYVGLIIPYVAFCLPFTVWVLGGFVRSIPEVVEEAARLDGCDQLRLFGLIVLPLMRPGIVASLLMVFILAWIEFLTPLLFTGKTKILTVALGLYRSTYDIRLGQLAAAAVLTALPVVSLTVVFQRLITRVLIAGADR